jgi:hypothetical protein
MYGEPVQTIYNTWVKTNVIDYQTDMRNNYQTDMKKKTIKQT